MAAKTRVWAIGHGRSIELGPRSVLMGVLNVTPDSFSDGGRFVRLDDALEQARRMRDEGASIVDVGGESTRPGAAPVSAEEEQRRILPVVEALAAEGFLVSIDTYRASTARLAIAAGAHIVNDVWGAQREPDIARVASDTGAGLCLMHTSRERETLPDPVDDQKRFLARSLDIAHAAGVAEQAIVLDPGFGFGKETAKLNFTLMRRFADIADAFDHPFLVGASRKRFVRSPLVENGNADVATAAANALMRREGASIFRVHDVAVNRDALAIADALLELET